ncbi:MAG: hypothetical protein ACE5IW_13820 [bacterium]
MDIVQFVTIDDGDDLVLSFSFPEGTQFGVGGFVIQRTPKLEFALMPHERGPSIDWTEDDEVILVKEVNLTRNVITIRTQYDLYSFDISKISDEEFNDVRRILEKMNFDNIFKCTYSE